VHIIKNLVQVASAQNPSRGEQDGLWKRGNDFFITFMHGGADGDISFQIGENTIFNQDKTLLGEDIRPIIKTFFGIDIPKNARIFVDPCHAGAVARKHKKDFLENNIFIYSGMESKHTSQMFIHSNNSSKNVFNCIVFDTSNKNDINKLSGWDFC
jgi:hypothetical protein